MSRGPRTAVGAVGGAAIKPMTSPVNWALLGLLIRRPDYGYRLAQRIARVYGDALAVSSESHVYTALNELARRGLIEEVAGVEPDTKRQPKVRYCASVEGLGAYGEWLLEQGRRQSPLFARGLAMLEGLPLLALEILDRYERDCLRRIGATTRNAVPSGEGSVADRIMTEDRRRSLEGTLPWIECVRNELSKLLDEPA